MELIEGSTVDMCSSEHTILLVSLPVNSAWSIFYKLRQYYPSIGHNLQAGSSMLPFQSMQSERDPSKSVLSAGATHDYLKLATRNVFLSPIDYDKNYNGPKT